jgi:hypothetical protein
MGDQPAPRAQVRVSAQVVASEDLENRLRAATEQIDQTIGSDSGNQAASNRSPIESAVSRADRLHRYWIALASPAIERGPGLSGRGVETTKRIVRRLTAWYVEPRWEVQREVNAEAARFATDSTDALRTLQGEIENLQYTNEQLLRRLHALEQAESRPTLPIEANVPR